MGTEDSMYACLVISGLPRSKERGVRALRALGKGSEMLNFDYLKRRVGKWLQSEGRSFGAAATIKISIIRHRRVVVALSMVECSWELPGVPKTA